MAGGYSAPGVYRRETDISDILISTGVSNGGTVVRAKKGPVRRPVLVTNNKEYVETFGQPVYDTGLDEITHGDIGGKLVPELGYGSYGALEFLKESDTLFVVRAYDGNDAYSVVQLDAQALDVETPGIPVLNTPIDVFDTSTRISTYDEYEKQGNITEKMLVGYVGPGNDGDNYAVTIDTITPQSEWLYTYDEYPTDTSATVGSIPVTDPNDPSESVLVAPVWGGGGYITKGDRFSTMDGVGSGADDVTIEVVVIGYDGYTCEGTTTVESCIDEWKHGYTDDISKYIIPIDKMTFYYTPLVTSAIDIDTYNTTKISITPVDTETLIDGNVKLTFLIYDTDNNGAYYKYELLLGTSTAQVSGDGSPTEVYKHFPIASEVIKLSVYKKPDDKTWEELYKNVNDANTSKLRLEPLEVFYGSMTPMYDGDRNELFIERAVNGKSKYIYVKSNGNIHGINEAPTASWNFSGPSFNLSDGVDNTGRFVLNTGRLAKLANGELSTECGLSGADSDMWEFFNNREELSVQILINSSFNQQDKVAVGDVCNIRRDCMATNPVGNVTLINYKDIINDEKYGYPASSFMALYAGYSRVFDTYNDKYVYLPNSIYAASLYARVDRLTDPWYAPAGVARGTLSVLDQNKVFSLDHIGKMYDRNINAIKFVQGVGFVMWGQKTSQLKKTALDRVNVRRNIIYIQTNIENALDQFIFENNTQQTRLRVYSIIDNFLAGIKAGDGVYDYSVVVDESNNPSSVIDANQLNVDIYVQPTKSIEFIQFTTMVTRTGVSFSDVKLKYT